MIDLMNGINGSNGKNEDSYIPCPSCSELKTIADIVSNFSIFNNEPLSITVDLLVSEVKMWRSKDAYERKPKTSLISSTIQKLQNNGLEMDS